MPIDQTIFRASDIRGIYPSELNESAVFDIVHAYCAFVKPRVMVVGKDVRNSGVSLMREALKAFAKAGIAVIDIGTVTADTHYFAVKHLKADGGIYISASHNPPEWNGLKLCITRGRPISSESGLQDIQRLANQQIRINGKKTGSVRHHDITGAYMRFVLSFIHPKTIRPLRVAANGNFGVAVKVFERIIAEGRLPIEIIPINAEPDGSFPKGSPNPMLAENRKEIIALVKKSKADLGVTWDADADRCFFVDEKGRFIEGYFMIAILARELLSREATPGARVIIDPRLIWLTQEVIRRAGGVPVIERAGGMLISERMRRERAIFAGEMSGHFYFKKNEYRDNGMIPLLLVLEMLSVRKKKLSQLVDPLLKKIAISGEINFKVADPRRLLAEAEKRYCAGTVEHRDGLSVAFPTWRFNLRMSNNEPLVRLNVEARSLMLMRVKTAELQKMIRRFVVSSKIK